MDPTIKKIGMLTIDIGGLKKGHVGYIVEESPLLSSGFRYSFKYKSSLIAVHSDYVYILPKQLIDSTGYDIVSVYEYIGETTASFTKGELYKQRYESQFLYSDEGIIIRDKTAIGVTKYDESTYNIGPLFKAGDTVQLSNREFLENKFGKASNGYPRTYTNFNNNGHMDKYFGAIGTVTNDYNGYSDINIEFMDKELNSKTWSFSEDMFELVPNPIATSFEPALSFPGSSPSKYTSPYAAVPTVDPLIPTATTSGPFTGFPPIKAATSSVDPITTLTPTKTYREFLPFIDVYTSSTVWKELLRISAKESLNKWAAADLFLAWCNRSDTNFKELMITTQNLSSYTTSNGMIDIIESLCITHKIEEIELAILLYKRVQLDPSGPAMLKILELAKTITNQALLDELDGSKPFPILSRLDGSYCKSKISNHFSQFTIKESFNGITQTYTIHRVEEILVKALVDNLNKSKATYLDKDIIIEVTFS